MNLQPAVIADLRSLLLPIDSLQEQTGILTAPIDLTRDAAGRLRSRLAELDQQIAASTVRPIPPDAQRVEALIAGEDVRQIDKKEIEATAAKARLLTAERQQITVDLRAVEARLAQLNMQAADLTQQQTLAERAFMVALGDALGAAYRQDIIKFLDTHIPALLSVAQRVNAMTGKPPAWHSHLMHGLAVNWPDENHAPEIGGFRKMHHVWPRQDGTLFSGAPSSSPDIVDELIAAVRASPDAAGADVAQGAA